LIIFYSVQTAFTPLDIYPLIKIDQLYIVKYIITQP